jgi:hypothetical protein
MKKITLEIQIAQYEERVKDATGKALEHCQHELDALKRRLKNIDKPSPVAENWQMKAQFFGNFYSLN